MRDVWGVNGGEGRPASTHAANHAAEMRCEARQNLGQFVCWVKLSQRANAAGVGVTCNVLPRR